LTRYVVVRAVQLTSQPTNQPTIQLTNSPDPVNANPPAKPTLWLRLKHYHFEHLVPAHLTDHVMATFGGPDAATRAFASKLSRKLGWTPLFAFRALAEYRKFVYLGMVSEVPVTPSKVIDQVWHEHLLFTRGYDQFCQEVLGRPFDHHPELVSMDDQTEVFQSQYEATLDLYETEFNCAPPADIWSTPKFKPGLARVRRALRKRTSGGDSSSSGSDAPLYSYFDGSSSIAGGSYATMPEFGGGGGFSGGGGESSWADSFVSSLHGSDSGNGGHAGSDSSSTDGGSHGSDSDSGSSDGGSSDGGSSDGGGSGCSSGCGGGGCGGGGE
jgi:hypothetical protein